MMKQLLWGIVFFVGLSSQSVFAQKCNMKQFKDKCVTALQRQRGYTFLKSYPLDGQGGVKKKIKYSYILSRGNTYLLTMANRRADAKGISVTITTSSGKTLLSSYDESKKKFHAVVGFKPKVTGIYYFTFEFQNTRNYCAASVLGFKR
ncbi:hypothetical protein M23134_00470 [Microscilla marina ATCC 23134]|uniref:DUF4251 domain-containing protein n=2 Tax=Microscilla marina TaxID=1027 RepID=A1ZJ50_MICM2|nr:hypothetical protein M23134_00470 [Microscilla marina ATCC 23134]